MDGFVVLILLLLAPGLPGAIITSIIIDKLRKKPLAAGGMEEFFALTGLYAIAFWIVMVILLIWKLM